MGFQIAFQIGFILQFIRERPFHVPALHDKQAVYMPMHLQSKRKHSRVLFDNTLELSFLLKLGSASVYIDVRLVAVSSYSAILCSQKRVCYSLDHNIHVCFSFLPRIIYNQKKPATLLIPEPARACLERASSSLKYCR